MFFSEYFNVDEKIMLKNNFVDLSLAKDNPFFIDPLFLFNSEKIEYIEMKEKILKYVSYIVSTLEKNNWEMPSPERHNINFEEPYQTWLGYTSKGNKGSGLKKSFINKLAQYAKPRILGKIVNDQFINKLTFLDDRTAADGISDFITKIIIWDLAKLTNKFALTHIDKELIDEFPIRWGEFNHTTKSWKKFNIELPFIINENGDPEPVILVPKDLLQKDDFVISQNHFKQKHHSIPPIVSNDQSKQQLILELNRWEDNYRKKQQNNGKPVYDGTINLNRYHITLQFVKDNQFIIEDWKNHIKNDITSFKELAQSKIIKNQDDIKNFIKKMNQLDSKGSFKKQEQKTNFKTTKEIAIFAINDFKHKIEYGSLSKFLYKDDGNPASELKIQDLFQNLWANTHFNLIREMNIGRGNPDFVVMQTKFQATVIEFKKASNSQTKNATKQLEDYKKTLITNNGILVIFIFDQKEKQKINKIIENEKWENKIGSEIFLINCSESKLAPSKLK